MMAESVYKVIELIGTSTEFWEKAAKAAVERAAESLRDLRVAEVLEQALVITDGKVEAYRTKLTVSFKYEAWGWCGTTRRRRRTSPGTRFSARNSFRSALPI